MRGIAVLVQCALGQEKPTARKALAVATNYYTMKEKFEADGVKK